MCGRVGLLARFDAMDYVDAEFTFDSEARYNVAPVGRGFAAIRNESLEKIDDIRWGLVPHYIDDSDDFSTLINGLAETAALVRFGTRRAPHHADAGDPIARDGDVALATIGRSTVVGATPTGQGGCVEHSVASSRVPRPSRGGLDGATRHARQGTAFGVSPASICGTISAPVDRCRPGHT